MQLPSDIELITIGASWGGLNAISQLLHQLTPGFKTSIVVVLHQYKNAKSEISQILNNLSFLDILEVEEKSVIEKHKVYLSAPNYHLLIENDRTFSLAVFPAVNHCRPSIDVLFESAADVYGSQLVAIVLTGANDDGAKGAAYVKSKGGFVIVQDPEDAEMPIMPAAALDSTCANLIASVDGIARSLNTLVDEGAL